jgi:hypothetical protein
MASDEPSRDRDSFSGFAGSELVLRLSLSSANPEALRAEVEHWLAQCAADAGLAIPSAIGLHSFRRNDIALDLYRFPDRVLATVMHRDPAERRRCWTTELDLHDGADLDLRLSVDEPAGVPSVARHTSAFVERIVLDSRNAVADVVPLRNVPDYVDASTVLELVALVGSGSRRLPVVVVSVPSVAEPFDLARRLAGAAHVICLDPGGSLALTETVGKWHSVFHGGVRTYPPGFNWESPARQAPLSLAARLSEFREGQPWNERLVRAILALTSGTYRNRPFTTVRDAERQERLVRDGAGASIETVTKLAAEIADLRAQRDALRAELDERNLFVREISDENEQLRRALRVAKAASKAEIGPGTAAKDVGLHDHPVKENAHRGSRDG